MMRETRSWARPAVLATTLAAALGLFVAPGASAAPTPVKPCPSGHFCLYRDVDWKGAIFVLPAAATGKQSLEKFTWSDGKGGKVAGTASSMINNSANSVSLYRYTDCSTFLYLARGKSSDTSFADNPGVNDNTYCVQTPAP